MVDTRTKAQRRRIMQSVRTKDTAPEIAVRRVLHGAGYRFRLHRKDLPGKPDIVFPSRKKAIFINGCFWHGHGCRIGKPPKSRQEYWLPKLKRNKQRDREKAAQLELAGWKVFTVWQCQTKRLEKIWPRLERFLGQPGNR